MKTRLHLLWELIRKPVQDWNNDNAAQMAAAIAYYTIFSIPPLLILAVAIAGYFFNNDTAQNQLLAQIGSFIGQQSADFIKSLLVNANHSTEGSVASLISIVVLLIGASGLFSHVQNALNTIWRVPQDQTRGLRKFLKYRLRSFLMVLAIGFLLLFFLTLSAIASIIIGYWYGSNQNSLLPEAINFFLLFVTITILFAMIFRVIPDKEIRWPDVWLGAVVTALLFMLGRYAIGLYLSFSKSASMYGAAGSLIILLIWIYYSAQIFLLGAEFTHVYARKFGSHREQEEAPFPMRKRRQPVRD